MRQAKAINCLTRLEVATRDSRALFILYKPRAAFYTENRVKMQNKKLRLRHIQEKFL